MVNHLIQVSLKSCCGWWCCWKEDSPVVVSSVIDLKRPLTKDWCCMTDSWPPFCVFLKYDMSHSWTAPERPTCFKWIKRILWSTVSKAALRSSRNKTSLQLCLNSLKLYKSVEIEMRPAFYSNQVNVFNKDWFIIRVQCFLNGSWYKYIICIVSSFLFYFFTADTFFSFNENSPEDISLRSSFNIQHWNMD